MLVTITPEQEEVNRHKYALLQLWQEARDAVAMTAKPMIEREQELRKEVAALFFDAPEEGTNTLDLAQGWKLKLGYKLDRKLDEAALPAVCEQLRAVGFNPDTLLRYKPELEIKSYRALDASTKAVFDAALTTKPASPTLELVAPKEKK